MGEDRVSGDQMLSIGAKLMEAGRHTIVYGFGSVVQSASGLILLPILTGSLSKEDFGSYSLILLASSIASGVFYLGITSALPRSYFDYELSDDKRAVFTTAFLMLCVGALLQILIGWCFSEEISYFLVGNRDYSNAVFYALLGGAIGFLNFYFFGYLRLLRQSVASVLFSIISLLITLILTVCLLKITEYNVNAPFEAMVYAQAVILIAFVLFYRKSVFILRVLPSEIYKLFTFGFAVVAASFGGLMVESLDRLMLEHFTSLGDVAEFSAALRVSLLINVIFISPFFQVWSPMAMEYRKKENVGDLFSAAFSAFIMLGGGGIIVVALFATDFLPLMIKLEWTPTTGIVFLTGAFGLLIFGTTNFFAIGLFYARRVQLLNVAYYGVGIVKFLANLGLIQFLGVLGAVISTFLSSIAIPAVIYGISRRYFAFRIEWKRLGKFFVIMLPSLVYGYISFYFPPIDFYLRVIWLFFTVFLIYKICLSVNERLTIRLIIKQLIPGLELTRWKL